MFFEQYNSIRGLSDLGSALSSAQAAAVAWNHTPFGTSAFISQSDFNGLIISALSNGYQVVQGDAQNAVSDDSIINAAGLDSVKATALRTTLSSMRSDGYYVVSSAQPVAPSQQSAPINQDTQSFFNPVASAVQNIFRPSRLPDRYITQKYRQTPADKQRLVLIIGGFGLVFAIAIGAIAARD